MYTYGNLNTLGIKPIIQSALVVVGRSKDEVVYYEVVYSADRARMLDTISRLVDAGILVEVLPYSKPEAKFSSTIK
jgi:hypothetical protein